MPQDLHMQCLCGHRVPIRDTKKHGVGAARCTQCSEVYDYSCWLIKTTKGKSFHKVEAYPRGVTRRGLELSVRCQACDACQEWSLTPDQAPSCTVLRKRGLVEKQRSR